MSAAADGAGALGHSLILACWGVRGSVPSPGPATARYGGNTACAELRASDGRRLVLDAGTGLRAFGMTWGPGPDLPPEEVDILVSHAHGDHLHGLGFFAPLAAGVARVTLHASAALAADIEAGVRAVLGPPLFPAVAGLADRVRVRALPPDTVTRVAGFDVRPFEAAHPGGATGFCVRDPDGGRAVAYVPDNELAALEGGSARAGGIRRALLECVAGVDLLVHDATYLPAELARHRGWGHSSYAEAVRLASEAGVGRLLLFHHHPSRDDAAVDGLLAAARVVGEGVSPGVEVEAAKEGGEVVV